MKILFFVLIAIAIIGLAECHGAHNHATPDFSKKNIHKAKENEIDPRLSPPSVGNAAEFH